MLSDFLLTFQNYHLLIILLAYLLTWRKSLSGGFVIDDDMGIQQFSERWQPEVRDASGKVTQEEKLIDSYKEGDKDYKFLAFLPHLGFPGSFMRWHRLHIGKKYQIIGHNNKGHEIYGFVQSSFRHHLWSMFIYGICLFLCYRFLNTLFGPSIAFPATLLFAVHPIISQCIAWISGIGYVYSLLFMLLNYVFLQNFDSYYLTIPITILLTFFCSTSMLVGCFNFAVLWLLGYNWEAFSAFIVGMMMLFTFGKTTVDYRRNEFKKQNMTSSITPNIRKPIVILKTLWYYICLVILPNKLGLYHTFGYHYSRKEEQPSAMFWFGLVSFIGFIYGFIYGDFLTKFCIVWFLSYFIIFSNFITANQFVVERYIFIPSLAYCILFARYVYPYPELFWFLIGLYMMRSILHVWTYKDHISFYSSNIQNFPNSEVAYGNLGVAHQSVGRSGTAFDLWMKATQINPHYDVPWYNMHSLVKTAGQLEQAREYLKQCMNAKVVHFKDGWEREMADLENAIMKKKAFDSLNKEMSDAIGSGKTENIAEIKKKMDFLMQPGTIVKAGS